VDTEPTEEKPAPSPGLNLLGRLDIERLARLLGACALALYVIGFIAVNGYLFQLDVTDFGLVRARFVYTGALLATSGVLPYVVLRTSFVKLELSHPPHGARNVYKLRVTDWVRLIAVLLAIPAILIVALIVINNYSGPKGWLKAAIVILPVYIIGLVLCYIVDRRFLSALGRTGERDAQRLLLRGVHLSGAEDVQRETQRDVRLLREVHLSRAAFLALYCFAVYIGVFMALSYPARVSRFWVMLGLAAGRAATSPPSAVPRDGCGVMQRCTGGPWPSRHERVYGTPSYSPRATRSRWFMSASALARPSLAASAENSS
jgi:hypothetical protein